MSRVIDIVGKKYGKWTVIKRAENKNGKAYWLCKCECGNSKNVYGLSLRKGHSKSCGCIFKQVVSSQKGLSRTRLYRIFRLIKSRCYNKNDKSYKYYGGKGVKVHEKWLNDFTEFYTWAINNNYNDKMTLDRINVNGNYEPSNCRWITEQEQHYNRTDNVYYVVDNKRKCLMELCREYNMPYTTVYARLKSGKTIVEALTLPLDKRKRNKLCRKEDKQ